MDSSISRQAHHQETHRDQDGKGKGAPEAWVAVVRPGKILYEMEGVAEPVAREALRLAGHKLGFGTKFVSRGGSR